MRSRAISMLLSASIALSSLPAWASNEDDAKDLFTRGRELRGKGDCGGAIPLFKKAHELYPQGLGSMRNLAECEEQVGKFASARRDWLDLKRALLVNKDAKYDGWDADADAAAARLAPKVARLTVAVSVKSEAGTGPMTPEMGLRVLVNGEAVDPKLVDTALDRDPGTYAVRVEGGREVVQKSVTLGAGEQKTLDLVVELPEAKPEKTESPQGPVVTPQPSTSSGSGLKTAGYVSLGIGGVALIATGVMFAVRQGALSDLKNDCPGYSSGFCTNASAKDASDRGKTASTLINVFGALAVVGLGVGITLYAVGSSKEPTKTSVAQVKLSPWATAGGGGAFVGGAF